MAQNSRPVFRSPSLEQETVEELSRRLLEITAQLNASNRSLQHLQQERTEMLANLSHDLRAPLTAIRSAVDYLTSGQSLSAQDIEGALTLIDHRTGTLEHLIRDMYELFTLEDPSHAFPFRNWMPRPFWKNISIPHFRTATMPVIFSVYLYRRISMPPFLQIPEN